MAGAKFDLPEDLVLLKLAVEPWAEKDDTTGGNEEEVFLGFLDVSKDQATSENNIPLSPQWLYAKPSEGKPGLSTASGDMRLPNTLPHGTSSDSIQRDARHLEGSQDKERRRNVPDVESSCRWREEERETSLLSRRECRKEGNRENEYHKNERWSDNVSTRENTDSRTLSSDRWDEGHEGWRDSKWSAKWGPEDKEKDCRTDKKIDPDKADYLTEKQSSVRSNRLAFESDLRDKWRPRHRQEVLSGGSSVYCAAPGFGLERGRGEGSNVGFAPGKGRSNFIGNLVSNRSSSAGPIGAVPAIKGESMHGKPGLSADTFRYPRGKLLDIYRKHNILSTFDTTPEGFEEVPLITQPSSVVPLAFVTPDASEEALLDDICKGNVTSSGVYYSSRREMMGIVNGSETDAGEMTLTEKEHGILSSSFAEETSFTTSVGYGASHEKVSGSLNEKVSTFAECKDKVNTLIDVAYLGAMTTVSEDDACCGIKVPGGIHIDSEQGVGERNLVNGGHMGRSAFRETSNFRDINSDAAFDFCTKTPGDSNSLFDTSFIPEISCTDRQHQNSNGEVKILEQPVPPEDLSLFYQDPQGKIQGPYSGTDIISWFDQGYFGTDLPVCLSDAPEGMPFLQLGEVMPHLKLKSQTAPVINPSDKSDALNTKRDGMEATAVADDLNCPVSLNDQEWTLSEWYDSSLNRQVQPDISRCEDLINFHGHLPLSNSEISAGILSAEEKLFHKFAVSDAEEVLYPGRAVSSIENPTGKFANSIPLSRTPSGKHFPVNTMGEASLVNLQVPTDNDLNPLGFIWSELEGPHQKHPLSSNIASISDQGSKVNPVAGGDASLFRLKEDLFSYDSPVVPDSRSSSYIGNTSSDVLQDAMVARHMSLLEPESNGFSLEEHLLSHQFQKHQLQQQHSLSPHQNMHLNGPFLEQADSSVQHQQSMNPSMRDLEHLLKLQFQQHQNFQQLHEQQQHFQQLHEQQQHHRHHQMQLQQQHQHHEQQHKKLLQQLLMEQLLNQRSHDPAFGTSHFDIRKGNDMLDQVLYRQQLLHELQQQSHHFPEHHDPSLEQLSLEQQFLALRYDHLQAWKFPMASRHQPGMEEERQVGRVWSVDETGQFIRAAAGAPQTRSIGPNQLDFHQLCQRPSSFESPGHLEENFLLHERMKRGIYEPKSRPFERSIPFSAGSPGSNVDLVNVLARFQGLDMQEQYDQMHSSSQIAQFPSGISSCQHQISNQFTASHLDEMEKRWSDSNGQLSHSLIESPFHQHLEMEQKKRNMKVNLSMKDTHSWTSPTRNDGNSRFGLVDFLNQEQVLQARQSLGSAPRSSYASKKPSWLSSCPARDNSFNLPTDEIGICNSFMEGSVLPSAGQTLQERLVNVDINEHVNSIQSSRRLASQRGSAAVDFDTMESGVEQARDCNIYHGELEENASIGHTSFGITGGRVSFNYGAGVNNAYSEEMISESRMTGTFSEEADHSLKLARGPNIFSSQRALSELPSPPIVVNNLDSLPFSEVARQEPRWNPSVQVLETPASSKDTRFRRAPSGSDLDGQEASFANMLKSSKKPAAPAGDASAGALDSPDAGPGGRSSKKKGKKRRQIDPSLLGFKVHSSRTMMGQIQRHDDWVQFWRSVEPFER